MFFKILNIIGGAFCALFAVFMLIAFTSTEDYEVHVTSDTLVEDPAKWEIQKIIDSEGNYVPSKNWEEIIRSGNFTPVSVASLEIRKSQMDEE